MPPADCRRSRPNLFKRIVARLFRRAPRLEDWSGWGEPPPDIGVREPRRPRPAGPGGAAVLDPPTDRW
jgi:hypothetical protein